jgi:hypothetical protein
MSIAKLITMKVIFFHQVLSKLPLICLNFCFFISFPHGRHLIEFHGRLHLERYNITGIAEFAAEMKSKELGMPKIALQFELSNSGITRLVKAEAAVEEIVTVVEEEEVDDDDAEADAKKEGDDAKKEGDDEKKNEAADGDETKENATKKEKKDAKKDDKKKKKKTIMVEKVSSQGHRYRTLLMKNN